MLEKFKWIAEKTSKQILEPEAVIEHHRTIIKSLLATNGNERTAMMHAFLAFSHPSYICYLGERDWMSKTKSIIEPFVEKKLYAIALQIIGEANIPDDEVVAFSLREWIIKEIMLSKAGLSHFLMRVIFGGKSQAGSTLAFLVLDNVHLAEVTEDKARSFTASFSSMNPEFLDDRGVLRLSFYVGVKIGNLYPEIGQKFFSAPVWGRLFSDCYPASEYRLNNRLNFLLCIARYAKEWNGTAVTPWGYEEGLRALAAEAIRGIESGDFKAYPEIAASNIQILNEIFEKKGFAVNPELASILNNRNNVTQNLIENSSIFTAALWDAYHEYFLHKYSRSK